MHWALRSRGAHIGTMKDLQITRLACGALPPRLLFRPRSARPAGRGHRVGLVGPRRAVVARLVALPTVPREASPVHARAHAHACAHRHKHPCTSARAPAGSARSPWAVSTESDTWGPRFRHQRGTLEPLQGGTRGALHAQKSERKECRLLYYLHLPRLERFGRLQAFLPSPLSSSTWQRPPLSINLPIAPARARRAAAAPRDRPEAAVRAYGVSPPEPPAPLPEK